MSLEESERQSVAAAERSAICELVTVIGFTETTIRLRVLLYIEAHIDVYFNERNGTTSYVLVAGDARVFGADNANGWHYHPFGDPDRHVWLSQAMGFTEFLKQVEQEYS